MYVCTNTYVLWGRRYDTHVPYACMQHMYNSAGLPPLPKSVFFLYREETCGKNSGRHSVQTIYQVVSRTLPYAV